MAPERGHRVIRVLRYVHLSGVNRRLAGVPGVPYMLVQRFRPGDSNRVAPSEITPRDIYLSRREVVRNAVAAGLIASIGAGGQAQAHGTKLDYRRNSPFSTDEKPNSYDDVTTYNNFYEFGTDKADPARRSGEFEASPWSVKVAGEAEVTGTFTLEDFLKPHALEERIYRLRCVEAWSMVVPWVGIPLSDVIKRYRPTTRAKYVAFKTVYRPDQMPGQRWPVLEWPYVEGLRIDEATHPLALLAVGLYGETLPNQNGAPLRLVVPWKYGFKGIKSIVEIRFTERRPPTTWNRSAPHEYGFYANVNPEVDHPRWSQATERHIGTGTSLFAARQATRKFNGYADEVAQLYRGMDLHRNF
jgi:methionine sulfoxide reductase catalytic subunit